MSQPKTYFFGPILQALENAFRQIETKVPQPVRGRDGRFRYAEQSIRQAIVQKLARLISGLHSVEALLERGLFQEQGIMQRGLDEIEEDIWFLALAVINSDITDRHMEYLRYFYAEEFSDQNDVVGSRLSRGMVKRDKIRAYVHGSSLSGAELERAKDVGRTISKAYSGYVHAASPHIMDMYFPEGFDVSGTWKHHRYPSHKRDARNVYYRAITAMAVSAKAFDDETLFASMRLFASKVESEMRS
ncbi:hypothetical protein [Bradyrhizobium sp. AUGA SZCCT0182]|uniref:hypothetical protein n=1 Tax=Bradyrhizobium sp. AUGA SZCCT0182 TaxID=2807667 RepID=UPI001BA60475|nr:hypothetical protein [Bradyrhizobium sp. AUGA SZCCT0182]MBR1232480.1 hypothetical protein [Bradyrhizobium sp. AUGA SZCCT0182]